MMSLFKLACNYFTLKSKTKINFVYFLLLLHYLPLIFIDLIFQYNKILSSLFCKSLLIIFNIFSTRSLKQLITKIFVVAVIVLLYHIGLFFMVKWKKLNIFSETFFFSLQTHFNRSLH